MNASRAGLAPSEHALPRQAPCRRLATTRRARLAVARAERCAAPLSSRHSLPTTIVALRAFPGDVSELRVRLERLVRVAFDSRPTADPHGVGRYSRCLLAGPARHRSRAGVVETHRPSGIDVFHAPWMQGAMLHSPCPMVVTSRARRAHAPQRAIARRRCTCACAISRCSAPSHVIVPTEAVADDAVAGSGSSASV